MNKALQGNEPPRAQAFSENDAFAYYEKMEAPERAQFSSHAIFGTLMADDTPHLIKRYNLYRVVRNQSSKAVSTDDEPIEVAVADIQLGSRLNGHNGVVHGGIISLLFDDAMGWGYEALARSRGTSMDQPDCPVIVTANLNIDYRSPLPSGSSAVIRVFYNGTEGRKVYFSARMESHDGSVIYSEAKALFVILKSKPDDMIL